MFVRLRWHRVLALGVLGVLVAAPATAQDVRYTTVSRGEFGGALGRWMKLFGGSSEITEVTSISGAKLRTDTDDDNSTVLDLDARAFTWMEHETKTYATMTFAQAAERANAMVKDMEDSVAAAKEQMPEAQEPENVRYEVRFSADRTGKKQKIAGYEAEQVFLQVEIEAIPIRQPDETEDEANQRAGTLVILAEQWLSTAFPGYTAKQAQAAMWAEALGTTEEPSQEMVQAYQFDPRIQQGLERLAEEMQGLEGEALRSVTHVVAVPFGVKFDRNAVLKDADKKLTDDVAGAAAGEAKNAAEGAVSGITGGLFGKKKKEPEPPKPKQATIMRLRTEVTDCSTATLGPDVFAVPAGYTERTF
jgi:hypothetical protein